MNNFRRFLFLALLPLAAGFGLAQPAPPQSTAATAQAVVPSRSFSKLAEDYWEARMRLAPLDATFWNYPYYHDRLDDNSPAGREAERKELGALLWRLESIDPSRLTQDEQVSFEVMKWELEMALESHRHKFHQWDVDHIDGPQTWIPTVVELAQPMDSERDARALLSRMGAMPAYFRNKVENLREGLREKRVAAKVPVERLIKQLEDILKLPADQTPYTASAKRLPEAVKAKQMPLIVASVEKDVYPAYREYLKFLKKEYLPKAREKNIGLSGLPEGLEAYRYRIRYHTTVEKTPAELHQIGMDELASIRAEMKAIAGRLGHQGELKTFLDKVRKDPKNFFQTREEVLQSARELVTKAQAKLPEFFGILPKTPLVIKPVEGYKEKNAPAAQYFPPPHDLSRPGIYYINTYEPASRPRFSMTSLAAHEGVPGHHFQIALAMEAPNLPTFRRHGGITAYVEGWALYTERLADEMGLYADDLSRVGMLSDQALRASRLVVDTGLHAMGWGRQKAVDFMKENTPMSEAEIIIEVDRYTIWPGQALAYKVGQREIMALRRESQERLGPKFDIKAFHDQVLKNGAIPLALLRKIVQ